MLEFKTWDEDSKSQTVWVDPSCVASVLETDYRRGYGGYSSVAIIRLNDGKEYMVQDPSRTTAKVINAAKHNISSR